MSNSPGLLPASTSGRALLSRFVKMVLGYQPTLMLGAGLLALPAAWITKVHMDWKTRPDAKKRMLIAHAFFWSSMLAGFKLLHAALFSLPNRKVLLPTGFFSLLKQLGKSTTRGQAAATLTIIVTGCGGFAGSMIAGFEGGCRLAKKLVPKTPKVEMPEALKPIALQNSVGNQFQTFTPPNTTSPFSEAQNQVSYRAIVPKRTGQITPIKAPTMPLRYTWNSSY